MSTATITFTVNVPVPATDEQIQEWAMFELGETCQMSRENPLCGFALEANKNTYFKITK